MTDHPGNANRRLGVRPAPRPNQKPAMQENGTPRRNPPKKLERDGSSLNVGPNANDSGNAIEFLLLPATTESLIELNQRLKLVELSLGQRELIRKIVGFVGQHFEVVRRSGIETLFGKLCRFAS